MSDFFGISSVVSSPVATNSLARRKEGATTTANDRSYEASDSESVLLISFDDESDVKPTNTHYEAGPLFFRSNMRKNWATEASMKHNTIKNDDTLSHCTNDCPTQLSTSSSTVSSAGTVRPNISMRNAGYANRPLGSKVLNPRTSITEISPRQDVRVKSLLHLPDF
jgi:hypothetical protein